MKINQIKKISVLLVFFIFCYMPLFTYISNSSGQSLDDNLYLENYTKRIVKLQNKYNESNSPLERYYYSQAMIDILEEMQEVLKEANKVYYRPAIMMMTGEIKELESSPLDEN